MGLIYAEDLLFSLCSLQVLSHSKERVGIGPTMNYCDLSRAQPQPNPKSAGIKSSPTKTPVCRVTTVKMDGSAFAKKKNMQSPQIVSTIIICGIYSSGSLAVCLWDLTNEFTVSLKCSRVRQDQFKLNNPCSSVECGGTVNNRARCLCHCGIQAASGAEWLPVIQSAKPQLARLLEAEL